MIITVRKWGNSLGMVIPVDVVSRLDMEAGSKLILEETVKGFRLEPVEKPEAWMEAYAKKLPGAYWDS